MKTLNNKVIVITGAGSGIGRALTLACSQAGARLALNDHNAAALDETLTLLHPQAQQPMTEVFDVGNKQSMFAFADRVAQTMGGADVLINNAGIGVGNLSFHETDLDLIERAMQVNYFGTLYGSRAFIKQLLQKDEAALANISSIFGLTGIAYSAAYCSSKFAVYGLNQALIHEYRHTHLTISSVHPGGVNTNITANALATSPQSIAFQQQFLKQDPNKAARTILEGIKRKKNRILIGSEAYQLDWVTRLFPIWGGRLVNWMIERQTAK